MPQTQLLCVKSSAQPVQLDILLRGNTGIMGDESCTVARDESNCSCIVVWNGICNVV